MEFFTWLLPKFLRPRNGVLASSLIFGFANIFVPAANSQITNQAQAPVLATSNESEAQYKLKLPVPLVIEDVVVLDGKGNPVRGLKASDFTVTESGKRVEIRNFEEHIPAPASASGKVSQVSEEEPQEIRPNNYTNVPRIPQSSSLTILLLDALNTQVGDQLFVRKKMLEFASELSPGTRIAIFGLSTHLSLLQGFTTDPARVRAALERPRGGPEVSPLLSDKSRGGPGDPINDALSSWLLAIHPEIGMQVRTSRQQVMAHEEAVMTRQRVAFTIQAINQLARYLSVLPGHKNLIWFSNAFPLNLMPNDQFPDPFIDMADFRSAVRETSDLLARSRVAVYPVDARGIFPDSEILAPKYAANRWLEEHVRAVADQLSKHQEADQTYAERDTMDQVATATGGRVFFDTNGLKNVVDKVVDYGESYYTLAYTPANPHFDGSYRKVAVKLFDQNLHTLYRTGYYGDDPNAPSSGKVALQLNAMQTAMLHGAPDAIQVRFNVVLLPSEKPVSTLTPGGHPDSRIMKPPYMTYTVQYIVDIRSIRFNQDASKVHHGTLELASYIYDPDGNPVNFTLSKVNLDLPDNRFAQVMEQGMLTRQIIEAPAQGEYYLRAGIHDMNNDHVGALEVRLKELKSLQELRSESASHQSAAPGK